MFPVSNKASSQKQTNRSIDKPALETPNIGKLDTDEKEKRVGKNLKYSENSSITSSLVVEPSVVSIESRPEKTVPSSSTNTVTLPDKNITIDKPSIKPPTDTIPTETTIPPKSADIETGLVNSGFASVAKFDSAPISDSDNRLYLSIEIAGKCYFALIDTGAVASFIGAKQ